MITDLPFDIIEKIYLSLDYKSRESLCTTSKSINNKLGDYLNEDRKKVKLLKDNMHKYNIEEIHINSIIGYKNIIIRDNLSAYCSLYYKYDREIKYYTSMKNIILWIIYYNRYDVLRRMKLSTKYVGYAINRCAFINNYHIFDKLITENKNICTNIITSSIDIIDRICNDDNNKITIDIDSSIIEMIKSNNLKSLKYLREKYNLSIVKEDNNQGIIDEEYEDEDNYGYITLWINNNGIKNCDIDMLVYLTEECGNNIRESHIWNKNINKKIIEYFFTKITYYNIDKEYIIDLIENKHYSDDVTIYLINKLDIILYEFLIVNNSYIMKYLDVNKVKFMNNTCKFMYYYLVDDIEKIKGERLCMYFIIFMINNYNYSKFSKIIKNNIVEDINIIDQNTCSLGDENIYDILVLLRKNIVNISFNFINTIIISNFRKSLIFICENFPNIIDRNMSRLDKIFIYNHEIANILSNYIDFYGMNKI